MLFALILSLLAIFLILLVLVQRGRGGGLAGALGGMGGSSAFGAKAGDTFTKITIVTAAIWIAFCLIALFWAKHHGDILGTETSSATSPADAGMDVLPQRKTAEQPGGAQRAAGTNSAPASTATAPVSSPDAPASTPSTLATPGGAGESSSAPPATTK